KAMAELHGRAQQDRGNEAGGGLDERRIVEVHEDRVLPAERIDEYGTGGAEREQFDLARGVDQDVVRLERLEDLGELPRVQRDHVRRGDLRSVRTETLFLHDLLRADVVAHVELGRVLERLGARIEVRGDAIEAWRVHPHLEGV